MSEFASESFNTVPRECARLATRLVAGRERAVRSEGVA